MSNYRPLRLHFLIAGSTACIEELWQAALSCLWDFHDCPSLPLLDVFDCMRSLKATRQNTKLSVAKQPFLRAKRSQLQWLGNGCVA